MLANGWQYLKPNIMKHNLDKFLIVLLLLMSCTKDEDSGIDYPYYKFSETEQSYLISNNYQIGNVLTYKNQNNETLNLKVIESDELKSSQYSPGTFSTTGNELESYFDRKIIRLEIVENGINYSCCDQINYVFSKSNNEFKFGLKFPLWNKQSSTIIDAIQYPIDIQINNLSVSPLEPLEIENTTYNRVLLLESESIEELNASTNLEIFVNQIYYDIDFGIVQFNDLNGMEWKLINN